MKEWTYVAAGALLALVMGVSIEAQQPDQPQDLKGALAQQITLAGQCQRALGAARDEVATVNAMLIRGELVDAKGARADFVAQFEKNNPGKTINDKYLVVEKPPVLPIK